METNLLKLPQLLNLIESTEKISVSKIMIELGVGFPSANKYIDFLKIHNFISSEEDKYGYYKVLNNKVKAER